MIKGDVIEVDFGFLGITYDPAERRNHKTYLFSGLIGIFFGFYPAYKASFLNPILALRYE